ncbi:MAG: hypothetical protein WBN23_09970, partial [Woeseia sp.]
RWQSLFERLAPPFLAKPLQLGVAALKHHPSLRLVAGVLLLLCGFLLVDTLVLRAGRIAASGYHSPWLALALYQRIGPVALALLVASLLCLLMYGGLARPWHAFQNGGLLRGFIVVLAAAIGWSLGTYSFNFYVDQAHLADRLALLVLVPLLWWRPGFIVPFVLLAPLLLWQFGYPELGGSIFPHKLQVLHVLNLFAAFFLLRCACGFVRSIEFFFLTACAIASAYWLPALGKFQIDWIEHVRLWLIPAAAATHGWLADAPASADVIAILRSINLPLALAVLLLEAAFLLLLADRRIALVLLGFAALFHVGVFVAYGFLFWTWILLDIAFLIVIWKLRNAQFAAMRAPPPLLLSMLLIGLGTYWISPPKLAWHDTRLTYAFTVQAVTEDGRHWRLPGEYFAPYDDTITMMAFSYLVDEPGLLTSAYGVTDDASLADAINSARTLQDIEALEILRGAHRYDAQRAAQFYEFLRTFVSNKERHAGRLEWLSRWRPPPQFWGFRGEYVPGTAKLVGLRIVFNTYFSDDLSHSLIRSRELNYLDLQDPYQPASGPIPQ